MNVKRALIRDIFISSQLINQLTIIKQKIIMVQNTASEAERSVDEFLAQEHEVTLIKHDKFKALE